MRASKGAEVLDTSTSTVRRWVRAGIAETVQFPDGKRLKGDWVERVRREGLTEDEMRRMSEYNRQAKMSARRKRARRHRGSRALETEGDAA